MQKNAVLQLHPCLWLKYLSVVTGGIERVFRRKNSDFSRTVLFGQLSVGSPSQHRVFVSIQVIFSCSDPRLSSEDGAHFGGRLVQSAGALCQSWQVRQGHRQIQVTTNSSFLTFCYCDWLDGGSWVQFALLYKGDLKGSGQTVGGCVTNI